MDTVARWNGIEGFMSPAVRGEIFWACRRATDWRGYVRTDSVTLDQYYDGEAALLRQPQEQKQIGRQMGNADLVNR